MNLEIILTLVIIFLGSLTITAFDPRTDARPITKGIIAGLLLSFCIWLGLVMAINKDLSAHKDAAKIVWSNNDLRAWYAGYNETIFYGQLPKDTVVAWGDLSDMSAMGLTEQVSDGRFLIRVDPNLNKTDVTIRETIIHEMCHIEDSYVNDDEADSVAHGPKWTACMVRIANHGGFKGVW